VCGDRYKRNDFNGDALLVGLGKPRLQDFRKSVGVSAPYIPFHTQTPLALSSPFPFWVILMRLVFDRSRTGLSASSSSTTYAPVVPSENVTINPSSPSGSVVSIRINSAMRWVYPQPPRKSAQFCSVGSVDSKLSHYQKRGLCPGWPRYVRNPETIENLRFLGNRALSSCISSLGS
jgi:hypothetical protein